MGRIVLVQASYDSSGWSRYDIIKEMIYRSFHLTLMLQGVKITNNSPLLTRSNVSKILYKSSLAVNILVTSKWLSKRNSFTRYNLLSR